MLVPKAGLEPARLAPHAPQNVRVCHSTTSATVGLAITAKWSTLRLVGDRARVHARGKRWPPEETHYRSGPKRLSIN